MGKKYIIEIPEDKITDFVGSTHFLMPYMMAGHIGHHDTGLPIVPYTEPDLKLIKEKAHDNGYSEGYQDGYSKGMNDYLQNPEVKEESDRAYAHGYSDAESKFSEIRKEAYDKGFEDGKELCPLPKVCHNNAYHQGLSDAWEAARKIADMPYDEGERIFGVTGWHIIEKCTADEVIEELKAREQERDAEIKIGDEVEAICGKAVVISVRGGIVYYIYPNGERNGDCLEHLKRTGRHFPEIAAIFEKMRNEPNAQIDT